MDNQGDAFFFAFPDGREAVRAAAAGQDALRIGKPDDARGAARDALADSQSIGDRQGMIYGIALLAWSP